MKDTLPGNIGSERKGGEPEEWREETHLCGERGGKKPGGISPKDRKSHALQRHPCRGKLNRRAASPFVNVLERFSIRISTCSHVRLHPPQLLQYQCGQEGR
ncbi:Hypothetical predicted protein [Podarcis lilfordi]|uniref:Uncharacterized protein n=1 Tax=Podarcis lilfordi TaxID=74358 RepID=A0AA35L2U7_9SAUR|nr:Hypothetical predicted protein [Podarcis lilfordi]